MVRFRFLLYVKHTGKKKRKKKPKEACVVVHLAGQFSGRGDDHSSEALVGWLLQVGEQWETKRQRLSRSCGSTSQELPTLNERVKKKQTKKTLEMF